MAEALCRRCDPIYRVALSIVTETFAPGLFAGRTALVTGGTSGIGLGAALALRDLGAAVLATGATDAECERAEADAANGGITFRRLDVREDAAIGALVEGLARLDVVVNAAGVIRRDVEHDPEVFAEVVAINLTGTMRVCAAAKPKLITSGGSVVNMASMLAFFGDPRVPGLQRLEGRHRPTDEKPRRRLGRRGRARQRRRAGLDRDAADRGPAPGRAEERADPCPHADGALGHAGGGGGRHCLPRLPGRPLRDRRRLGGRR